MLNQLYKKNIIATIVLFAVLALIILIVSVAGKSKSTNNSASKTSNEVNAVMDEESSELFQPTNLEIPKLLNSRSEQIIEHIGYTVSFNHEWNIPNWVAYELTSEEVEGVVERGNHFKPDPLVKGDPVVTKDYSNSGYDRGHMAPAADMKWSKQAMEESFYMTNMCPQNHNLNAGDWKRLEEQVRDWAQQYDHVYVCCGPIVSDTLTTIGYYHRIVVPTAFYKVVLREKGDTWSAIGFVMNNCPRDGKWKLDHYVMEIDLIEKATNIDFFPNLPNNIEETIEHNTNLTDWSL